MKEDIKENHEHIVQYILYIRDKRVILDSNIARIYGVQTKRLNEQVKRNIGRFPEDFMFRLTDDEFKEVVANCDHLKKLKFSSSNPYAFTEHGALMLSAVLNTPTAIETSIFIVRAFVKLRTLFSSYEKLEEKIIRKFRQWMQQKRYAEQTISRYTSMLEVYSWFEITDS